MAIMASHHAAPRDGRQVRPDRELFGRLVGKDLQGTFRDGWFRARARNSTLVHILLICAIGPASHGAAPDLSPKEAHMIALKDVLVATDFEEAAAVALTYGRSLARTFGARLHVVHVLDDIGSRAATMAGYGVDIGRMQVELEAAAQAQLDSLLWDEDRKELGAKAVLLTSTSPASAIVQYATDAKVNLIVVGTHGRGAVSHFLLGSVAERVVRLAPCPVLTVRSQEREFVMPDALQRVTAEPAREV
jgi:nucleotide-binding universal stress UspA family protein